MAMTYGIHLPQYGRVASGDAVARAARHAEDLGFATCGSATTSSIRPSRRYPSPFLLDPFATLSWAAAVTSRVRLGTSVLVVPQHNPVWLANHLASVDVMSGGRLIVGAGDRVEQAGVRRARSVLRDDRGRRMDEILDLLRAAWTRGSRDLRRRRPPPRGHPLPAQARAARSRSGSAGEWRRRSDGRWTRATGSTSWV